MLGLGRSTGDYNHLTCDIGCAVEAELNLLPEVCTDYVGTHNA